MYSFGNGRNEFPETDTYEICGNSEAIEDEERIYHNFETNSAQKSLQEDQEICVEETHNDESTDFNYEPECSHQIPITIDPSVEEEISVTQSSEQPVEHSITQQRVEEPNEERFVTYAEYKQMENRLLLLQESVKNLSVSSRSADSDKDEEEETEWLKSKGGKKFEINKKIRVQACQTITLASMMKLMALAYNNPRKVGAGYFRRCARKSAESVHNTEFVLDLIEIGRLMIRKLDKFSKQPVLRIMREGENQAILFAKKKLESIELLRDSTTMTTEERKMYFSAQLTVARVTSWSSEAFVHFRKKGKKLIKK